MILIIDHTHLHMFTNGVKEGIIPCIFVTIVSMETILVSTLNVMAVVILSALNVSSRYMVINRSMQLYMRNFYTELNQFVVQLGKF